MISITKFCHMMLLLLSPKSWIKIIIAFAQQQIINECIFHNWQRTEIKFPFHLIKIVLLKVTTQHSTIPIYHYSFFKRTTLQRLRPLGCSCPHLALFFNLLDWCSLGKCKHDNCSPTDYDPWKTWASYQTKLISTIIELDSWTLEHPGNSFLKQRFLFHN